MSKSINWKRCPICGVPQKTLAQGACTRCVRSGKTTVERRPKSEMHDSLATSERISQLAARLEAGLPLFEPREGRS